MVRVTGPCFSLDARQTIGQAATYSFWRGVNYVRARVIPHNPKSVCQSKIRAVLTAGVSRWRFGFVTQANKNWWNTYAKGLGESGWNRYTRSFIEKNYHNCTVVSPYTEPSPE